MKANKDFTLQQMMLDAHTLGAISRNVATVITPGVLGKALGLIMMLLVKYEATNVRDAMANINARIMEHKGDAIN